MTSKLIGFAVLAAAVIAPSIAFAQTSTTGLLNVYVQVINQTGYTYNPGSFTVTVSGTNPSPATFTGSNQGTKVSLSPGNYSVALNNQYGYGFNPTYSVGCNSSIAAGDTQTCVITLSAGNYWGYPNVSPFPYSQYQQPALRCVTNTPIVSLGQSASFTAQGGAGGTYNWATPFQNHPNIGPVLTTSFNSSGTHAVTVTNASQTATCTIVVNNSYVPQPVVPTSPIYPNYTGTQSYVYPYGTQPTYAATYIAPRFPNTGFEPIQSAQIAFALVLVMGAAIASYPYARKAFALALR